MNYELRIKNSEIQIDDILRFPDSLSCKRYKLALKAKLSNQIN